MGIPSLNHWADGRGRPVSRARNWAGLPSTTVTSSSFVTVGGSSWVCGAVKNKSNYLNELHFYD